MFDSSLAFLHGLCFWLSRTGPVAGWPRMPARSLGSRACSFSTCSWLLDYAGPDGNSRLRSCQCGLPARSTRSAPDLRFSKLNSRPVDASVYASPGTSRHPAQDSRSRWFATPFLWGSFIPDYTPVYPDDCVAVGTAVSRCPPHRPVLAALPHTVLTLDVPPVGGWRGIARLDSHEQCVEQVASDRIVPPVSPRWAAFGCAVPAHETSSGRPVAGIVSAPSDFPGRHGIGSSR